MIRRGVDMLSGLGCQRCEVVEGSQPSRQELDASIYLHAIRVRCKDELDLPWMRKGITWQAVRSAIVDGLYRLLRVC